MSGPRFSSQAGLASLRHGRQVILTPDAVQGMVPRDGEQAFRAGDRIVPARQARELLAAVEGLPPAHDCPGLKTCVFHGRWTVIKSVFGRWWALAPTGPGRRDRKFPTFAEAVAYATERARAEQLAAITHSEGTDALPADLETP